MLVPLVTTDLAESGGLDVLSTARVREALRQVLGPDGPFDASFAREVARAAGAELMLIGDVTEGSGGLQVVGEIVEVASGRSLGSARARSDAPGELFRVATDLCTGVRGQLGLRAPDAEEPFDAAASLTSSTAAWNLFVAGRVALHEGDYGTAQQHFEGALREDETFALAAFYLSIAIDWGGATDKSELRALERGLPHLDRLPERWRATYEAAVAWAKEDWEAAYVLLDRLAERPDVPPGRAQPLGRGARATPHATGTRRARARCSSARSRSTRPSTWWSSTWSTRCSWRETTPRSRSWSTRCALAIRGARAPSRPRRWGTSGTAAGRRRSRWSRRSRSAGSSWTGGSWRSPPSATDASTRPWRGSTRAWSGRRASAARGRCRPAAWCGWRPASWRKRWRISSGPWRRSRPASTSTSSARA